MIKNLVRVTCKVNNRDVELSCDSDCPFEVIKEALFQFQKYIGQVEDQVKAAQEQAKAKEAEAKAESPKAENVDKQ